MNPISRYRELFSQHLDLFSGWGFWVGALVVAAVFALSGYELGTGTQSYSQLIPGSISWRAASKNQDYFLLFGFVLGFLIGLLGFVLLAIKIRVKVSHCAADAFHSLVIFCSLPAVFWVSSLILNKNSGAELLVLSAILIGLILLCTILALSKRIEFGTGSHFSNAVVISLLIISCGFLAGSVFSFMVSRLGILLELNYEFSSTTTYWTITTTLYLITIVALAAVWSASYRDSEQLLARLRKGLIIIQCFAPWLFLSILPTPWIDGDQLTFGYPIQPTMWILLAALAALTYVDVLRRWNWNPSSEEHFVGSAISPLSLVGLVVFLKSGLTGLPVITQDDYHFGEFLLPWWSWAEHSLLPFWDFSPARGMINYIPGMFSSIFFDGSAASMTAVRPLVGTFYLLLCFPIVARVIDSFPALLAFLIMPLPNGTFEIHYLLTAGLCLICESYLRLSRPNWLMVWLLTGLLMVLAAPGQGALLVLATSPLGMLAAYEASRAEPLKLLTLAAITVVGLMLLFSLTPLGYMLFGAVRYGFEQSSVNNIANGIEWSQSWSTADLPLNVWLWEIIRASWIIVALIAGVLTLKESVGNSDARRRTLAYSIPIFLLALLFIIRAAGRIDPNDLSRLGTASIWALSLLLPILLIKALHKTKLPLILVITVLLTANISSAGRPYRFHESFEHSTHKISVTNGHIPANTNELNGFGNGIVSQPHLDRIKSIGNILGILVDPGETYLDLTNRSTHYFYLGYKPPIEVGAVYNLVSRGQRFRAVEKLKLNPPPVVLASADNILHDGGTNALRSHELYRFVIENYHPVRIDGQIYMVRSDRLPRIAHLIDKVPDRRKGYRFSLLDRAFLTPHFHKLPTSWGRSLNNLRDILNPVDSIKLKNEPLLDDLEKTGKGDFKVSGSSPSIMYSIATETPTGHSVGILSFEFRCTEGDLRADQTMEIAWQTQKPRSLDKNRVRFNLDSGTHLVPMDSAPRWLLAKRISRIQFRLPDPGTCSRFSISDIRFWQRTPLP